MTETRISESAVIGNSAMLIKNKIIVSAAFDHGDLSLHKTRSIYRVHHSDVQKIILGILYRCSSSALSVVTIYQDAWDTVLWRAFVLVRARIVDSNSTHRAISLQTPISLHREIRHSSRWSHITGARGGEIHSAEPSALADSRVY